MISFYTTCTETLQTGSDCELLWKMVKNYCIVAIIAFFNREVCITWMKAKKTKRIYRSNTKLYRPIAYQSVTNFVFKSLFQTGEGTLFGAQHSRSKQVDKS